MKLNHIKENLKLKAAKKEILKKKIKKRKSEIKYIYSLIYLLFFLNNK